MDLQILGADPEAEAARPVGLSFEAGETREAAAQHPLVAHRPEPVLLAPTEPEIVGQRRRVRPTGRGVNLDEGHVTGAE